MNALSLRVVSFYAGNLLNEIRQCKGSKEVTCYSELINRYTLQNKNTNNQQLITID